MTPAASDDDGDQRAQSDSGGEEQPQSPLAPPNGAPPDGSEDGYWESGDEYEEGWLSGDDEDMFDDHGLWFDDEWDEEMEEMEAMEDDEGFDDSVSDEPSEHEWLDAATLACKGVHMLSDWAAFAVPTAAPHFQAADGLAVAALPPERGGSGLLAATIDKHGVAAWRLPATGAMHVLGAAEPRAVRLGGCQSMGNLYSLALSPDAHWLAAGGEGGLLTLYSIDPTAAPRPEGRLRAADLAGGHHYLYTPLLEPEQHAGLAVGSAAHGWEQGQRQQGQQGQQAGQAAAAAAAAAGAGHPGARLPLLPLALLQDLPGSVRDTLRRREAAIYQANPAAMPASFQALLKDATAALLKAAGDGAASQQTAVSQQALLDQQSLNAPPQHAQQQQLGKGKRATAANVPAGHASTSPPHAAIMLRGVFGLGLEPGQTEPYVQDGMLNGVRFGLVAGRQRLLAAEQCRWVYVFEQPPPLQSDLQPAAMLCDGLGAASPHWQMRPVTFFSAQQHCLGACLQHHLPEPRHATRGAPKGRQGHTFATAAIGPLPVPCNLAAASPDGRWIAVVGDRNAVFLVDQHASFAWRELPLVVTSVSPAYAGETGSQYCAWNSSSTLLAVSSDALRAVFVFEPESGRLALRAQNHKHPCLAVGFAPWDDRVLLYSEDATFVHLRSVPHGAPPPAMPRAVARHRGTGPRQAPPHDRDRPSARATSAAGGGSAAQGMASAATEEHDAHGELQLRLFPPGVQVLHVPVVHGTGLPDLSLDPHGHRRRRITGLAATAGGDVLVATRQGALLRFFSSQPWRQEQHSSWPPAFRAAVAALLLCAQRQGPGAGVWSLPASLLLQIVSLMAGQRTDWMRPSDLL